jgi:hypothetical protein
MNTQPMTIPVRDALLENVETNSVWEKFRWEMSPADAEEPAKVLLRDEEDETTTGTTTPASERSSSRSDPPSPGNTGRRRGASKDVTVNSGLTKADVTAEKAQSNPGQQMVTMRNISYMYTEQMVLEELWDGGFQQLRDFEFFYMPVDPAGVHLGCCLVGFTDNAIRNEFLSAFQGRSLRLAGPTALPLKVQSTSSRELELLMSYGTSSAKVQQELPEPVKLVCPLKAKAPRKAQFCPFCGNHVGHSNNFCSQCGSSLMQLR